MATVAPSPFGVVQAASQPYHHHHHHHQSSSNNNNNHNPAREIAHEFIIAASSDDNNQSSWKTLPSRLERLCERLRAWNEQGTDDAQVLRRAFAKDPVVARRDALTAAVLVVASQQEHHRKDGNGHGDLLRQFESLFRASLDLRDNLIYNMNDGDDDVDDNGVDRNGVFKMVFPRGEQSVHELRQHLCVTTAWLSAESNSLLYAPLMNALQSFRHSKMVELIGGDFETEGLYEQAQQWTSEVAVPWLKDWLLAEKDNNDGDEIMTDSTKEDEIKESLEQLTAESFCFARIQEIFDIVTSYPDSLTAVEELCEVLPRTNMYHATGQYLRDSLIRRLNHPGADTSQIIDVYINTIKVLRRMDPTDRLLEVVAEPVRTYLRSRSDTVRCIITSLTDAENGGDLYQELRRQDVKLLENVTVDSDDEEEPPDMNWQPPPSLNQPKGTFLQSAGAKGDSDILAMLVSIYGSKELFVNEYRLMLADKLLANLDYNTDKERHTLELLKLRFGEVSMNSAEVMIKDIDDSVRANKNIHDSLLNKPRITPLLRRAPWTPPAVDAAMISHIFWPRMQNESLKHHPRIQVELDSFSQVYAEQKNPRKLNWISQLGTVQLEVDVVEDGPDGKPVVETKEFTCSPLLATLLSHFEDNPTWTAEALSNETGIPESVIRKRISFWITHRVLVQDGDEYTLASRAQRQAGGGLHHDHHHHDDEGDRAVSAATQQEEEYEVYESYICVMLTSLKDGASLDKIHNMLKMMASGSETKYNKSPQQLSAFLQRLCRQEKLECGPDGTYKLVKKRMGSGGD